MPNKRKVIAVLVLFIILILVLMFFIKLTVIDKKENGKNIQEDQTENQELIGGQRDEQGCLTAGGYSYNTNIKACTRDWELDNDQEEAAKIAVDYVKPAYALTIEKVDVLDHPGSFTIHLTDNDFEKKMVGLISWNVTWNSSIEA
ncbi:MAG: hypothetical protein ABIH37_00175 [archaeon]